MAALNTSSAHVSSFRQVRARHNHFAAQCRVILDMDHAHLVLVAGPEDFQRARIVLCAIPNLGTRAALGDRPP